MTPILYDLAPFLVDRYIPFFVGYLHVTYADIRAMESDAHYDICVLKMLSQWRDTGTEERPRTVRDLLDTLYNPDRPRMYRDLKEAVSGKNKAPYMYQESYHCHWFGGGMGVCVGG